MISSGKWNFLVSFLFIVSSASQAADWPQFLGLDRNGVSSETNLAITWPKEGPKILWQKKVGQGFSGPVVVQEKLILFHRLDDKETVECFEAHTGKPLWKFDYPTTYQDDFGFDEGPRATPTIADGKVYVFGAEGMLHCLDFSTGKKIWNVDCKTSFHSKKGFFGRVCSPLVEGDQVLMNIGGEKGAGIVAFNKSDGKIIWKTSDDEAGYSSPVAATINGKRLALFFTRRGLLGLNPKNGTVQFDFSWRSRMDASVNAATPLVIGDLIFLSASYGTGAILLRAKENNLEKVWSGDDVLSNHYSTSVHHDGFLYGFHGRQEQGQSLRCVELKTGKVRWSEDDLGAGTVTLADKHLYVLSEKGELIQAEASSKEFKILNRAQILPFGVRAYPALSNGRFYARSKDKLICTGLLQK